MTPLPSLLLSFILFQPLLAAGIGIKLPGPGNWTVLHRSIGVSAMHMQLLPNDRVIIFDLTSFGPSNLTAPRGQCRIVDVGIPPETKRIRDCTSHSVEYNVRTNKFRPLFLKTDVWCSSGALVSDGTLVQAGGFAAGGDKIRIFHPCNDDKCNWKEVDNGIFKSRWYPTSQTLPDGRVFIVGGRDQQNYEFYPKLGVQDLQFLKDTFEKGAENNLYPFVFLNVDGNLFIFANNRAILLNYKTNTVVREYPMIPGSEPRSYPSTGSAVLLPLQASTGHPVEVEVLVCGGAPRGAFQLGFKGKFLGALDTCARININDRSPKWFIERMSRPHVMGDMILLPNSDVLIINGASRGSAGWQLARSPVLEPVLYRSYERPGMRFAVLKGATIPRMYHSSASLLRDGRILVGGSNPHEFYAFGKRVLFPTELSLEAFHPPYLDVSVSNLRPTIHSAVTNLIYRQRFEIQFSVQGQLFDRTVSVTIVAPSFNTHSFSMNQRLLVIGRGKAARVGNSKIYEVGAIAPNSPNLAPPGYYMLFVVDQDIPSEGVWLHIA